MSDSPELEQVVRDYLDELDRKDRMASDEEASRLARDFANRYGHIEGLFHKLMDVYHTR